MPVPHDVAAETELWDTFAESAFKDDAEPVFCWTQYPGHGPGPELLGSPRSVLEIGCGTGRALAYLAMGGVTAHGVDLSPVMVKKTSSRWAGTGATFTCGEVLEYLAACTDRYDTVYSIFGAAWFADPGRLFPSYGNASTPAASSPSLSRRRSPGPTARRACTRGFAGRAMFTYRYSYRPAVWERLLSRAGFASAEARVIDAPTPGHIGTLIVRAEA